MDLCLSTRTNVRDVHWRQVRSYSWSIGSGMCLWIPPEVSFWIQTIFCQRSYVGMLVLTYDASAIRQDPNLFLPQVDSMDPVVSVCHHHTPAIGYFSKSRHLAILSDSIKPWPMTPFHPYCPCHRLPCCAWRWWWQQWSHSFSDRFVQEVVSTPSQFLAVPFRCCWGGGWGATTTATAHTPCLPQP